MSQLGHTSCGGTELEKSSPTGWAKRLTPTFVAEPWGRRDGLPGPDDLQPLGEIIYEARSLGLVIKWLQTCEALPVQIPAPGCCHKDKWWQILEARPGASIGLSLKDTATSERLAAAAQDGSLPGLMDRIRPRSGGCFHIEAGILHALGPQLTVLEIQETGNTVCRLFDHARLEPHPLRPLPGEEARFAVTPIALSPGEKVVVTPEGACLAVVSGEGELAGHRFAANECWLVRGPVALQARSRSILALAEPRNAAGENTRGNSP